MVLKVSIKSFWCSKILKNFCCCWMNACKGPHKIGCTVGMLVTAGTGTDGTGKVGVMVVVVVFGGGAGVGGSGILSVYS